MDMGLEGRTAIVCGASSGMGLATAEALAAEGANVVMFGRRRELLEREADRVGALAVQGDLTIPQHLERLVQATVGAFGGVDVLVLNGGGPPAGKASTISAAAVEEAVALLLTSHVTLVGRCLPHLRESGRGRIVAIESSSVREPLANLALSNAVRPGVVGWLKTLARELGPDGITVNTIAPGSIDTDRLRSLRGPGRSRCRGAREHSPPAPRSGERDSRRGDVSRVRPRRLRDRRRDPGRRRTHPQPAVKASTSRWLLLAGGALLAVVVLLLATMPANDYLFVPNSAHPIAGKVEVEGKSGADGPGGIYYVDVTVRKVRWLERLLPFARPDGASLVPAQAVTAPGESFRQRIVQARAEMKHSEQVAAAVALRADGRDVETVPRGVLVEAVALDVPAAKSLSSGDVIVGVDGRKVTTVEQLLHATRALEPGDEVALRLRQDDKVVERTVRTVAAPDDPKRAIIGISVSQDAKIDLPLDVNIDLGNVGGPSAGLPFALQIYQELGHDVDRGRRVAATGEIELDGSVEPVGGIKQKTYGVRSSGADVFLVPAGENAATARRYAGGLRIVPVKSFEQALRVLRTISQK